MLLDATDDWDKIRQSQSDLNTRCTQASTTLDNEIKAHNNHQAGKPTESLDDLKARKTELEARNNSELIESKARLDRHKNAQTNLGTLAGQKQDAQLLKKEWDEIYDEIP